jgi:hypothetical protein
MEEKLCGLVFRLLEGRNVNLKIVEKEDASLLQEWWNNPEFSGVYNPLDAQQSKRMLKRSWKSLDQRKLGF